MKLSVIGCGYLGAVHAACMAELGHEVVGIDVDATKVTGLSAAQPGLYEPGLVEILARNLANGRLRFTTDYAAAAEAKVHFLGVGTPQKRGENAADLAYVFAALDSLAPYVAPGALVVGKSTVPVGTAATLETRLHEVQPEAALAWNPEFLREGVAVADTISPDRIVYGLPAGDQAELAQALLDEVYAQALAAGTPLVVADYATAELVKVAANAFLATKISFINAMSEIADTVGADVTKLADAIGYDARIGRKFLNAGVGFGGGCLPKDIRAFRARAEELGLSDTLTFLKEVDTINLRQRERVVQLTEEALGGQLMDRRVAVLGLAFKPESDDIRDSPALDVAVRLHGLGAEVACTDPKAIPNAARRHPQLHYVEDTFETLRDAEAVLLLTEWSQYRELQPEALAEVTSGRIVIDGRNVLDPARWRTAGWTYVGIGRS
ncbi:MAG: UDP-glucose/GDP-mannose dehydrogenase family protein [Propionicimonas sp.]|uniref:UDP-glucose dehydrogenase family protein n=1 Tax=Propionicimonas sp. TaxID=1955623 RepID=UPI001D507748|nr:UDP-glucose/GDP-mannose dehydrogenase family protein [Propionicimonas sp.]MBU4249942.1 UDP-glucose/GDP-mannose dehydrogenase family protein [Actinomycetota bacterium]MBU4363262.1 UDP-glucose/GDP-mannose dehydrogenase family protein [Actinomycetota bacterium]MBU4416227.1 UDP-glucose/GDP-mannose dehydrogenase family protein [Actinomycetota bacterium]MBU4587552.1 UDP-glucose/GDP-mannose dehydrogenase family protein [Actinomycetota bacterium]MCG2806360.1 UDP-glucose/GDP-mannose dehydrogenase fa